MWSLAEAGCFHIGMGTTPARDEDASKSGRSRLTAAEEGIVAVPSRAAREEVGGQRLGGSI